MLLAAAVWSASRCGSSPTAASRDASLDTVVYLNDFNGSVGTIYPEWSTARYSWTANQAGTVVAGATTETVTNIDSANGSQRFLGELGGPVILNTGPYDSTHFVRVDESVTLSLDRLPAHTTLTLSFDVYVLKSWDGDSAVYGPDRWSVGLAGAPPLLATTFSNNFKTSTEGSVQTYPAPGSAPQTGAIAVNTLGYAFWFGDSIYHFTFDVRHATTTVSVVFTSSLFEGKSESVRGTRDESWGLDNVRVTVR